MKPRKPTNEEINLIKHLIEVARGEVFAGWEQTLLVQEMNDGGMGSLSLLPEGSTVEGRHLGKQISECQFNDEDGVTVIASLNLDADGRLFELDIWKTDFGKLIQIPDRAKLS